MELVGVAAVLVVAWFAAGTIVNVRKGRALMRWMQDGLPLLGFLPGLEGFYTAVSHSGVTLGPLFGKLVAGELVEGRIDPRLEPYRPTRFPA